MVISEEIARFLKMCEEVRRQYDFYYDIVGQCDKKTTDFLHSLELDELDSKQRAKMATAERKNLQERRQAKNIIEENEFLRAFLGDSVNMKVINLLKQVLGETRKIERYHENRTYKKRILSEIK